MGKVSCKRLVIISLNTEKLHIEVYLGKMKVLNLFLVIIVSQFMFHSCVDDDVPPKSNEGIIFGPYYLNEAKDYIHFKRGTWWVYENSNTGQRDSVVVFDESIDTVTYKGGNNKIIREQTSYKAFSHRDKYNYTYYLPLTPFPSIYSKTKPYVPSWGYRLSQSKQGDVNGSYLFYYPWDIDKPSDFRLDTTYASYHLNGKEYKNVLVFWIKRDFTFPTVDGPNYIGVRSRYYYAPKVGVIYKEDLTNNKHWELVKSRILQ